MSGSWGKTWRWALLAICLMGGAASAVFAGEASALFQHLPPLFRPVSHDAPDTPLEAQMGSERPPGEAGRSPYDQALRELLPGVTLQEKDGGAVLRLPQNFLLNISFRYGKENGSPPPEGQGSPHPVLLKSSLDYSLLPNLQVGLSGFLYHGVADSKYFQRRYGDVALGLGPGVRYDLGRWSLTLQSQYGLKGQDQKQGLHWFRVWYAF